MDWQELVSLLPGEQHSGYAPKSGAIIVILKEVGTTINTNLDDAAATTQAAVNSKG